MDFLMMDVVMALMYTAVVIISVLLIGLILVQPSKGGDFGSAFGGVGESVFGAHTMGHLSKVTIALLCVFFVLTLGLAVLAGHKAKGGSMSNSLMAAPVAASPAEVKKEEKKAPAKALPVPVKKLEKKPAAKAPAKAAAKPAAKAPAKAAAKPAAKAPAKKDAAKK